jgi:hypothetical protein
MQLVVVAVAVVSSQEE